MENLPNGNGITNKTKVSLPLGVFIVLCITIISITISSLFGITNFKNTEQLHSSKITELECNKLDKAEYNHDKNLNRVRDSLTIERKLNLILKKLKIPEEY